MIYKKYDMEKIPDNCESCSAAPSYFTNVCFECRVKIGNDRHYGTRNEHCPLRYGSVMEWIDVRDRLPDFTGPVLVTVIDRKFNQDPKPEVKAATYKTKYMQFFRVTGNVIAWMPYPEVYRR